MQTKLRDWKLKRMFALYDVDGDGLLDEQDLRTYAEQIAGRLDAGTAGAHKLGQALTDWHQLVAAAAGSAAGESLDENRWINAVEALGASGEAAPKAASSRTVTALLDLIDTNSDGVLSSEEFERFYWSFGGTSEQAATAFALLDRNGDGVIDVEEFLLASHEHMFSDDPDAKGNWLLGPPDEQA
ncbi:EF-hand domain-containing protein [Streptomyces sp. QH1-20]|uniref:EF-hand domain-containing protein n=1 Tax=Streptomyces sp. QH1-20 TaxID=3240934 RepID=UPI0035142377